MKSVNRLLGVALAGLALTAVATVAHAQAAPAPIGFWATANGAEQLTIQANGCALANAQGQPVTSGPCSWNPSSNGGILTIMSSQTYKPAPIYYNVVCGSTRPRSPSTATSSPGASSVRQTPARRRPQALAGAGAFSRLISSSERDPVSGTSR
jgi:hypothetical protein